MESRHFLIMTTQEKLSDYWQRWKIKKSNMRGFLANSECNHPNRVAQMATSGGMTLTLNKRDAVSSPFIGQVVTDLQYNIDFSLLPAYTRKFLQIDFSYLSGMDPLPEGQFLLTHQPIRPWLCLFLAENHGASNVGTLTATRYTYTASGWDFLDETVSDVDGASSLLLQFGGFVTTGSDRTGGFAEGSDDYKTELVLTASADAYSFTITEKRYPWNTWGSMSDDVATQFSDLLADINATGDYVATGSISLSFDFS
jgi:hypothetical protein